MSGPRSESKNSQIHIKHSIFDQSFRPIRFKIRSVAVISSHTANPQSCCQFTILTVDLQQSRRQFSVPLPTLDPVTDSQPTITINITLPTNPPLTPTRP
jgi:hypothetical protein